MGVEVQLESWPGMFHDWQMMAAYLPEGQRAINQVGTFIRQQTGHTRNR